MKTELSFLSSIALLQIVIGVVILGHPLRAEETIKEDAPQAKHRLKTKKKVKAKKKKPLAPPKQNLKALQSDTIHEPQAVPKTRPKIEVNDLMQNVSSALTAAKSSPIRSKEWAGLPKQDWERDVVRLPPEIDPLGFDTKNRVSFRKPIGFHPLVIPSTEKLNLLGQVVGSRSEGSYLSLGDTIYIRADQAIQVGEIYGITTEPTLLKSRKSDRVGYSYMILGTVRILGVRDGLFVGTILSAREQISRGNSIIINPAKIPELTVIPAPTSLQGVVLFDHHFSTFTAAQHKEIFIDRGSEDGIKPGMIFRAYEHTDPSTDKKLTHSDFIIDADIIVTQVTELFSTGLIISNNSPLAEHALVTLLTDVSDVQKNQGFREKGTNKDELDDLESMDQQNTIGKGEKKELKQLENWKNNPNQEIPPPPPASESNTAAPEVNPAPPTAGTADMGTPPPPPPPAAPAGNAPGNPPAPPASGVNSPESSSAAPPPSQPQELPPSGADAPVVGNLAPPPAPDPTSITAAPADPNPGAAPPGAPPAEPDAPPPPPAQ